MYCCKKTIRWHQSIELQTKSSLTSHFKMEEAVAILGRALFAPENPELQRQMIERSDMLREQKLLGLAWLHVYQGLIASGAPGTDAYRVVISRVLNETKRIEFEDVPDLGPMMAELALPVFCDFMQRDDRFDPATIHDLVAMVRLVCGGTLPERVVECGIGMMSSSSSIVDVQKGIRIVLECIAVSAGSVEMYRTLVDKVNTLINTLPRGNMRLQVLEAIASGGDENPHFVGRLISHMTECPLFVEFAVLVLTKFAENLQANRNPATSVSTLSECLQFVANTICLLWETRDLRVQEGYLKAFLKAAYFAMRSRDLRRAAVKGLSDLMRLCHIDLTQNKDIFRYFLKCAMCSEEDFEDEDREWFDLYCPYEGCVYSPRLIVLQEICLLTPNGAPIILQYVAEELNIPKVRANDRLLEAYLMILAVVCESNPHPGVVDDLVRMTKELLRSLTSHGNPRVILTLHYLSSAVLGLVNDTDLILYAKHACTERFKSITPSQCDVLNFTMACHLCVALARYDQVPMDQLGVIVAMMDRCSSSDASKIIRQAVHSLAVDLPTARKLLIQTIMLLHSEFSRISDTEDREVEEDGSFSTLTNQLDICTELLGRVDGILVNDDVAHICEFVKLMTSLSFSPILEPVLLFIGRLLPRMLAISPDGFCQINEVVLSAWRNSRMVMNTGYDFAKMYMQFFSGVGYNAVPLPNLVQYMTLLAEPFCQSHNPYLAMDVIMVHSLLCRIVQCEAFPMADLAPICELIVRIENGPGNEDPASWTATDLLMRLEFRLTLMWRGDSSLAIQDAISTALLSSAKDLLIINYHRKLFIRAFSKFLETNQDPGWIGDLMSQLAQGPQSLERLKEAIYEYCELDRLDELSSPIDCDIPGFVDSPRLSPDDS